MLTFGQKCCIIWTYVAEKEVRRMAETEASFEIKTDSLLKSVEIVTKNGNGLRVDEEACLIIVLGGNAVEKTGENLARVTSGDVRVLFPGTDCEYTNMENFRICVIRFDYENLLLEAGALKNLKEFQLLFIHTPSQMASGQPCLSNALGRDVVKSVEMLVILLEEEFINKKPEYEQTAKHMFLSLVSIISRYCSSKNKISNGSSVEIIANVATYMENNYADAIKLEDLASLTHYSCRHFTRLFQEHFRTSPMTYLNSIRMYKAGNMIIKTSLSIEEVAHRSGFEDSGHFCRQFKRHYGITPKQWRKQHAENQ